MSGTRDYERLKALARAKRGEHEVTTGSIGLSSVRGIYKAEGIKLDLWHYKLRRVRAAYFICDGEPHVLVNAQLPEAPRLFAECHELKHHYEDRAIAEESGFACEELAWAKAPEREIGAEVFAAEFIYPESEFLEDLRASGLNDGNCTVERVIALKRGAIPPISYQFIVKRLEWFGITRTGQFAKVQWKKREAEIYGPPVYVQIRERRARMNAAFGSRTDFQSRSKLRMSRPGLQ